MRPPSDWLLCSSSCHEVEWEAGCIEKPPSLQVLQLIHEVLRGTRLYPNSTVTILFLNRLWEVGHVSWSGEGFEWL